MRILKKLVKFIPIVTLGLIPLLWFKKGYLIGGVDIDFPLFPIKQFFLRLCSWNPVLLGGDDYSTRFSGLFSFTLSQALLKSFNLSLIVVEKIYFVFWYTLTGLSMYFFMSQLVRGKDIKSQIIRYIGVFFYMINFYQLHIWMIARKPELSGAILIPALFGIMLGLKSKQLKLSNALCLSFFLFWATSGIGLNPPVVGIVCLFISMYFIYYVLFLNLQEGNKRAMLSDTFSLLFLFVIFILVNLHWILPVGNYILNSQYTNVSSSLRVFNILGLLGSTSRYNSFLNVLRLYGDNIWFDGFKGRLYLPFFANYLDKPLLILLSFLFPMLAFSAVLISRTKHVMFFTITALFALFMSKGIHPPLGNVFLWLIYHFPGFWIYRAPWQKFTLLTILSYSYLAAITCGYLYEKLPNVISLYKIRIKYTKIFFLLLLITVHLIYHYGFILGRMLPTTEERQVLPGFHQKYPNYLFESAEWINSQKGDFKIILLPDDKANAYYWGYGGAYDISLKLFTKGVIFRQYGEGMAPPHSLDKVYDIFVTSLYNELTPYVGKIAGLLNVRYLLHRNDFIYNWAGDNDSPEFIKERLKKQEEITLEKSIGEWDFYKNKYEFPHIYIPKYLLYIDGDIDILPELSFRDEFNPETALLFSSQLEECDGDLMSLIHYKVSMPLRKIEISVYDGNNKRFSWENLTDGGFEARYYKGIKEVIRTDGKIAQDMLVFNTPQECPYIFSSDINAHSAYNSTIIYIKTGDEPVVINNIYENDKEVKDIVGIWWESGWMGMGTKSIFFPIKIPANERAIVQINHIIKDKIKLLLRRGNNLTFDEIKPNSIGKVPHIIVNKINSTRYLIKITDFTDQFILVFNDKFHPKWNAYVLKNNNIHIRPTQSAILDLLRFGKREKIKKHFKINGYANAWLISNRFIKEHVRSGNILIVIEYLPQRLFEIGVVIFIILFLVFIVFFMVRILISFRK